MCHQETAIKLHLFTKGRHSLTLGDLIEKLTQPAQLSCSEFCRLAQNTDLEYWLCRILWTCPLYGFTSSCREQAVGEAWKCICAFVQVMKTSLSWLLKMWVVYFVTWTDLKKTCTVVADVREVMLCQSFTECTIQTVLQTSLSLSFFF